MIKYDDIKTGTRRESEGEEPKYYGGELRYTVVVGIPPEQKGQPMTPDQEKLIRAKIARKIYGELAEHALLVRAHVLRNMPAGNGVDIIDLFEPLVNAGFHLIEPSEPPPPAVAKSPTEEASFSA